MRYLFISLFVLQAAIVAAAGFDHSRWDSLLTEYVEVLEGGKITKVDYGGIANVQTELTGYLRQLSQITRDRFDTWPEAEQLAFLINAYNAWTVDLILTRYPDLHSIKDLGSLFQSPWKKKFIFLLEKERSLDDIEHVLIRGSGRYNEPRIHFAVNCASIGCPALRNQAYRGDILEKQLDEVTRLFLSDKSRNRSGDAELQVSSIFKWYREDFERNWRGANSLPQFLALYRGSLGLSRPETEALVAGEFDITFLDYDWKLNSKD